ncbi:hypothetical protein HYS03_01895 [Candidatus Woesebacteria bacterium]|nr:hypothetical protein [Candidatus Woesebacteria bacterium]QQG47845.1 MAG: hypothetical protein HY044_02020 [Candidatus Woesebacteria bacterium]
MEKPKIRDRVLWKIWAVVAIVTFATLAVNMANFLILKPDSLTIVVPILFLIIAFQIIGTVIATILSIRYKKGIGIRKKKKLIQE